MGASSDPATSPPASSPLPPCPEPSNCERISQNYPVPPEALYQAVQETLADLGPTELRLSPEERRAEAVYRVALVFKDDVDAAVTAENNHSALHVRSASRVGSSDLGVNRRRVERLLSSIERYLGVE